MSSSRASAGSSPHPATTTPTTPASAAFNNSQASNIPGGRELRQPAPPVQQHDCNSAIVKPEIVHSRDSLAPSEAAGSTPDKSSESPDLLDRPDAYACEVELKDENLDDAPIEQGCADEQEPAANEQHEPDDNSSAVQSVASAETRVQPQVALPEVDAPAPVVPPASRRPGRRSPRSNVGDTCVAHRTRARSGRRLAHRAASVRATRSRVRAGDAYLVAGLD